MRVQRFEDLEIWQKSMELTREIYALTRTQPFSRDFCLRDQIRKAVISVPSNIAEGFEKNNNNEFCRFLRISKGSLGEVRSQLYIAKYTDYISPEQFQVLYQKILGLGQQIGRFIIYLVEHKTRNT